MFGGEFPLMDLLVMWDTIFAKTPQDFALVNYIFIAMLILLRNQCKYIYICIYNSYFFCYEIFNFVFIF